MTVSASVGWKATLEVGARTRLACHLLAFASALFSPAADPQPITDVCCEGPCLARPLAAPAGVPKPRNLADAVGAPQARTLIDSVTLQQLGRRPDDERPLQQVLFDDAKKEAERRAVMHFDSEEKKRQEAGKECTTALEKLQSVFKEERARMRFPSNRDLAYFASWYFSLKTPDEDRRAALRVVEKQREYDEKCLAEPIPVGMDEQAVRNAYAVLMFEDKVLCTGLRDGQQRFTTARHCFVNDEGALLEDVVLAHAGKGRFWIRYQGEPQMRFEVCRSSLPRTSMSALTAANDHLTVQTAKTAAPAPTIRRAQLPLPEGTSLYLRGWFAFAKGPDPLEMLRATRHGGCVVTASVNRCLFHGCQATPGMSGAPVLLRPLSSNRLAELTLVGFHLGPARVGTPDVCILDGNVVGKSNFSFLPENTQ